MYDQIVWSAWSKAISGVCRISKIEIFANIVKPLIIFANSPSFKFAGVLNMPLVIIYIKFTRFSIIWKEKQWTSISSLKKSTKSKSIYSKWMSDWGVYSRKDLCDFYHYI